MGNKAHSIGLTVGVILLALALISVGSSAQPSPAYTPWEAHIPGDYSTIYDALVAFPGDPYDEIVLYIDSDINEDKPIDLPYVATDNPNIIYAKSIQILGTGGATPTVHFIGTYDLQTVDVPYYGSVNVGLFFAYQDIPTPPPPYTSSYDIEQIVIRNVKFDFSSAVVPSGTEYVAPIAIADADNTIIDSVQVLHVPNSDYDIPGVGIVVVNQHENYINVCLTDIEVSGVNWGGVYVAGYDTSHYMSLSVENVNVNNPVHPERDARGFVAFNFEGTITGLAVSGDSSNKWFRGATIGPGIVGDVTIQNVDVTYAKLGLKILGGDWTGSVTASDLYFNYMEDGGLQVLAAPLSAHAGATGDVGVVTISDLTIDGSRNYGVLVECRDGQTINSFTLNLDSNDRILTDGKAIWLKDASGTITIQGLGYIDAEYGIYIKGSNGIDILGHDSSNPLRIENAGTAGIYIENSQDITMQYLSLRNNGIVVSNANSVTIRDVTIDGFNDAGISIQGGSTGITVQDVEVMNGASGATGIEVLGSTATIGVAGHGNLIHDIPNGYGIYIDSTSTGCHIDANTIYNVGTGIVVEGSGNTVGQSGAGNVLYDLDTGISIGGTAAGNDVGYNDIGYTYGGVMVGIVVGHGDDSNPNEIHDNMITVSNQGIQVTATSKNEIYENTISCAVGILLDTAANQLVHDNTINSATSYGIEIKGPSHDNEVYGNVINGGSGAVGIGIHDDAYSNKIYGNQITSVYVGIGLYDTDTTSSTHDNEIYGNEITDASHAGIHLNGEAVQANMIYDNTIALSSLASVDYGILSEGDNDRNYIGVYGTGYDPNVIHGAFHYAIYVSNSVSFHVENNDIDVTAYGAGSIGIYFTGSTYYGSIKYNNILAEVGIKIESAGSTTSSTTTYGNTIGTASNPVSVGIEVTGSTNVILNADTVYATDKGVYVHGSSQSITVQGEIVSCEIGIEVDGSFVNVEGNTITANDIGIYYHDVDTSTLSTNLLIKDNEISGLSATATNKIGIYVYNVEATSTSKLVIEGNTIHLSSLLSDSTGIKIENSKYIEASTSLNEIYNFDIGVLVTSSQYIDLQYLKIHDGDTGIKIEGSTNVRVMDNVELYNLGYGIYVTSGSSHVDLAGSSIGTTNLYIHDTSTGIYVGPGSLNINIEQVLFEGTMNYGILFEGFDGGSTTTQAVVSKCKFDSSDIQTGIEVLNSKFVKITDTSPFTGSIGTSANSLPTGIAIEGSTNVEIDQVQIYADTGILVENTALPTSGQEITILNSEIVASTYGIRVVKGNGISVGENNDITSTNYGIYVEDSATIAISGSSGSENNIHDCGYGLYITGSTNDVDVSYGIFQDNQYGIYVESTVTDVEISGGSKFIVASHSSGMVGVHVHGASGVRIHDSSFVDLDYGILVDNGASNVNVYGNEIVNATWTTIGIEVTGNSQMSAYGNQFIDLYTGIYVVNNLLAAYGVVIGDTSNPNEFDGVEEAIMVESSRYVQIIGNNFGTTAAVGMGINILDSNYVVISNNNINNADIGIFIDGYSDNIDISYNYIAAVGECIDVFGVSNPSSIYIHDMNDASHYLTGAYDGIIIDSVLADSSYGVKIENVKLHSIEEVGIIVADSKYIEIDQVFVTSPTGPMDYNAVLILSSQYVKLHDSTFEESLTSKDTVRISESSNVYIEDNSFTGSSPVSDYAIILVEDSSSDVLISGNTIKGGTITGSYMGILVKSSQDVTISSNTFESAAAEILYGIKVEDAETVAITNNIFQAGSISNYEIFVTGSSEIDLDGNELHGSSGYGVYLDGANDVDVHGNSFYDLDYDIYITDSSYNIEIYANSHQHSGSGVKAIYIGDSHDVDVYGGESFGPGTWHWVIQVWQSYNVTIKDSSFGNDLVTSGHVVIDIRRSHGVDVLNNAFGAQSGGGFIIRSYSGDPSYENYDVNIEGNTFSGGDIGIEISEYSYDHQVHGNRFTGAFDYGIMVDGILSTSTPGIQIYGNTFESGSVDLVAIKAWATGNVPVSIYGNTINLDEDGTHAIDVIDTGGSNAVQVYDNTISSGTMTNTIGVYVEGSSGTARLHAYSTGDTLFTGLTFAFYVTGNVDVTIENHQDGEITDNQYGLKVYQVSSGTVVFQNNYVDGLGAPSQGVLVSETDSPAQVKILNNNIDEVDVGVGVEGSDGSTTISGNTVDAVTYDVKVVDSSGVTITGNTLDATYGIYLDGASSVTISDNDVCDNDYGIYVKDSSTITIDDSTDANNVYNNDVGIYLTGTDHTITISGNNIYDNTYGIKFESATVSDVTISSNNLYFSTTPSTDSYLIWMDSTSSGSVMLTDNILTDNSMPASPSHSYGFYATSTGIVFTYTGGSVSYLFAGFYLTGTLASGSSISSVTVGVGNNYGIYLDGSVLSIASNLIKNNEYGAYITENGVAADFSGNAFNSNEYGMYVLEDSAAISGNSYSGNSYGIYLDEANNAVIFGSTFSGDGSTASIYVYNSDSVVIGDSTNYNTFTNGLKDGIYATGSDNIQVIYNRFSTVAGTAINVTAASSPYIGYNQGTGLNVGIHVWSVDVATIEHNSLSGSSTYGILVQGVSTATTSISNNIVHDFDYGICVTGSSNVNVAYNDVHDNECGICIRDSSSITIEWNTVHGNTDNFCFSGTISDIVIRYNDIYGSTCGIHVSGVSGGIIIAMNKIHNNDYGVCIEDSSDIQVIQNRPDVSGDWGIYDNTIAGVRIYGDSSNNKIWDNEIYSTSPISGASGVLIVEAINNNVSENKIYGFGEDAYGIYILAGSGNEVWNNEIYTVEYGIYVNGADTSVKNNHVHDGVGSVGVYLGPDADGTIVVYNTITAFTTGILADGDSTNLIETVTLAYNTIDADRGIETEYVDSSSVSDNVISATSYGIVLDYTTNVGIRDNEITGSSGSATGISVSDGCDMITIANNRVSGFHDGVFVELSTNVAIDGNEVYSCYIGISADLTGPAGSDIGIQISNNVVHDVTDKAIDVEEITSGTATVSGNYVTSAYYGIYIDSVSDIVVQGNTISNVDYGIYGNGDVATVTNNNIQDVDEDAINLYGFDTLTVQGNEISDAYRGIYVSGIYDLTVMSNTISDVDDDGIYVSGVDYEAYVQDNTINNVDDDAIYVYDAGYVSVFGNSIEYVSNNGISVHDSFALIYSNHIEEYYNYGIELDGSDYSEIHDNTLINCYGYYASAIYVEDSWDSSVYGNTITYSEGDGIHVDGSDGIEIYDNTIRDIYDTAIYVYDSDYALIHDNDIAPGSYNEHYYGIYVSSSNDVEVFGNSIVGGYWTGIRIYSSDGAVVHDNEVNDAYEGISAEYADNIRIDNNTITLGSYDDVGIEIDSSYGRIDNNEISGPLSADITGIETYDTDDVIYINGNTITATYGIDISYSTWNIYVYDNTITASDTGIKVYVAWYLTINSNSISGSSGSVGIYMQGVDWWNDVVSTYVQDNTISGFVYGIKMVDYIDYSYVLDNEISDVTYGIVYFANETDGIFWDAINYNNITASYYGIYINTTGAVIETDVKYNYVDAEIGIVVSGAKYVYVENNVVDATTMGIMVQSWFDGSTWYYANGNHVEYNVVNATDTGIYFFDAWNSLINYNTVMAAKGIIIEDVAHSDVEHNVVTASLGIASYNGYDNDIRYNEIYASGTDTGIAILNGDGEDVEHNSVDGFDYGIAVSESTEIDVVGNTVTNSTTAGIYVDSSTDTLISDNEVSGGLYGIYDTEAQTEDLIASNTVDGADTGIYASNPVGYVNITENTVTNASTGIYVINVANNIISGNSVSYTVDGIVLETVDGTEVSGNTVSVSSLGIYAEDSHAITIEDNAVESEGNGIVTVVSQYNYIQDNDVTAAGYGIAVYSDESSWVQHNDVAAGTGILVGSSTYTEVKHNDVTESTYGIVVYDSSYVHVAVNDVTASYAGIYVYGVAEHQLVENNDVISDAYGIYIDSAISTAVRENDVTAALAGVYLFSDANTEVTDNDVTGSVYGVLVEGGAFQYVADNTITSDYVGVGLSGGYNVTVEGNTITAAYAGVHLADDTVLTEVSDNSITSMYYGVHVEGSGNNTVADNTIDAAVGVEVEDSPYILVQGNTIGGGFVYKGIEVVGSTYVEVYDNTVTQSTYGIYVKGEREARLSYLDIKGNDVSYASLYGIYVKYADYVYLTDNSVSYSMYGVVVKRSTNVLVTGDSTFMNRIGHYVLFSSQVRLTQIYAENDDNGFFVERSTQVWVDNSTFYRDVFAGVVSDSNEFVIENNTVIECVYGIVIRGSQDAEVRGNTVSQTVYIGMWIDMSSNINIHDNYVHDSYVSNLKAEESTGLTIEHNVFVNSTNSIVLIDVQSSEISYNQIEGAMEYGLKLLGSSGNQIFLNNFVDNNRLGYHEAQAFDDGENTYYTMVYEGGSYRYYGNYWSDHTSPDSDGDGIVDAPYAIEGGSNEDPYPLVAPISL